MSLSLMPPASSQVSRHSGRSATLLSTTLTGLWRQRTAAPLSGQRGLQAQSCSVRRHTPCLTFWDVEKDITSHAMISRRQ